MAWRKRILTSIIIGDFRLDFRSKFLIGADNLCIERFELVESSSSLWPNGKTFNLLHEHEHEASTHRGEPSSAGPDGEPKIMIWFHNPCLPEQRLETFQSGNGYARSGIPKYQTVLWLVLKISATGSSDRSKLDQLNPWKRSCRISGVWFLEPKLSHWSDWSECKTETVEGAEPIRNVLKSHNCLISLNRLIF